MAGGLMAADVPLPTPTVSLAEVGLALEPTVAMRRGEQHAFQCAWCGTVVVVPAPAPKLGRCPNNGCERPEQGWWRQHLGDGGLAGLRLLPPAPQR
ncbi:MAG TPA: hypothetical protein VHD87_15425 [Acidimicrobiales bacterium]|nr:hypothetical protein [Acidimicrobiales bacterium]